MDQRVTYFASGSNHPGEMLGFALEGHPFGVAIKTLDKKKGRAPRWVWLCGEDPELVEYSVIWPEIPEAHVRGTLEEIQEVHPGWFTEQELARLGPGDSFEDRSDDGYTFRVFRHVVDRAPAKCLDGILRAARRFPWVPVFVDSGAFSEVEFFPRYRTILEITDADWRERLATSQVVADALGSQAYIVAPDKVGDQKETLRRMRLYAPQVRSIRKAGANILVPLQRGPMDLVEYERHARKALGFSDFLVAFPMKKGATELSAIKDFLRRRRGRLAGVHLLGLGPTSDDAPAVVELLTRYAPGVPIYMDSVLIRAHVKRDPKTGKAAAKLTEAQDMVLEHVLSQRGGALELDDLKLDWTEVSSTPSAYTTTAQRREIGRELGLGPSQRRDFASHPDDFLQMRMAYTRSTVEEQRERRAEAVRADVKLQNRRRRRVDLPTHKVPSRIEVLDEIERVYGPVRAIDFGVYWYEDPQMESLLEAAYAKWVEGESVGARKAASIRLAFGRDPESLGLQRRIAAELQETLAAEDIAGVDLDAVTALTYAGTWIPEEGIWQQTVELPEREGNPTRTELTEAACVLGRASWGKDARGCGTEISREGASRVLSEHRWASGQYRRATSAFVR